MLDAAILSEPTPTPDTDRAAIRKAVPPGIAQVLYVVRFLISYACHIAATAEKCSVRGDISPVSIPFPKCIDICALIIRVARGLKRALALQEMLEQRAATGADIEPVERRPHPHAGGSRRGSGAPDKQPKAERLPSAAEIAAELQRRSIGAIVADICHDIGIVPSDLTDEQWDALQWVIHEYGGNLLRLWPAMKNTIEAQMEAVMLDPANAPDPQLPLIPWTRAIRYGAAEVRRTGPP
jgi:hypothetical protein